MSFNSSSGANSVIDSHKQLPATLVLLLNTGLMWFGFFMLIPLVALHATRDLGVSAAMAGLVLAVRQFVQQGLGIFIAASADWMGYRRMMLTGMLVRAIGFAYLAVAPDGLHLMLAGVVAALGGACFDPSGKAAMAVVSRGYRPDTIFALVSTVSNVGMTTGPLLGVALLKFDFKVVGLVSACVYIFCFFLLLIFIPVLPPTIIQDKQHRLTQIFKQLGTVWSNHSFVRINLLFAGYYILYVQINITLPLYVAALTGSEDNIVTLYAINSGLAIALQYISVKFLRRWFQPVTIVGLGTGLAALGLVGIVFVHTLPFFLACVVIYSLGRLMVEPMTYTITLQYATPDTMASYFGFSSLALAVGGVIGNSAGGWLFDLGNNNGWQGLCWLVLGGVGLLVIVGVILFQRSTFQSIRVCEQYKAS